MSCIAIVTRARAPYLRDLQEAFAQEIAAGSLHILWPDGEPSDFDDGSTTPQGSNLTIHAISSCPVLGRRFPSGQMWSILDNIQPDLVWIHEFSPFTLGGLLYAKRHGIPVVESTEVGQSNAHFFSAAVRVWHFLWGHLVDGIIANAPAARNSLSGERRPVVDAFHAVDSRHFSPPARLDVDSAPTTFVVVGKLIARKGTDLLLKAASRLRQLTDTAFRIRFVGSDPGGWGRSLVTQLQLDDCVEFPGFLQGDALMQTIASADAFVLPTRQDTYAAVVHEAACLGLPLLVSIHAGACEALVEEGTTGSAIDPENTETFAQTMKTLCEDPELRRSMSQASRAAGERFSAHQRAAAITRWMHHEFSL